MNVNNGKIVGLVCIAPLIAFLTWILFRGKGHNYAENFVLAAFLFGLSNIFRVAVFIPLHLALPGKVQLVDGLFQVVFLFYLIVAFRQFFQSRWVVTVLKSILTLFLFILLFWGMMYLFAFVKISVLEAMA